MSVNWCHKFIVSPVPPFTTFPCLCQYPRNCPTFSFFIENRKVVYILISFNVYTILFENWEEKKLKLGSNREK